MTVEVSDEDRLVDELASLRFDHGDRPAAAVAPRARSKRYGARLSWVLLVVITVGVGGYWGIKRGRTRMFPEEVEASTVSLMSAGQEAAELVAAGYVYSRRQAVVAPKVLGRLKSLLVEEGVEVREGQLLAELDPSSVTARLAELDADVATAEAGVEQARAELADCEARLARERELERRAAGVPAALEDARLKADSIRAQLAAAQAQRKAAEIRLRSVQVDLQNTKIRAPFAGTIVRKLAEVGEVVAPQGAGILQLVSLEDLEMWAEVSEARIAEVKVGAPVEIRLDSFPDRGFRGKVKDIRRQVDRAKAAVTVKVGFADPTVDVLPDMAGRVGFLRRELAAGELTAAPKTVTFKDTVVDRRGKKVLFAIRDGVLEELSAEVAVDLPGGMVELKHGPPAGTRVVRHPSAVLQGGSPIKEVSR